MTARPSRDDTYMSVAEVMARRSLCVRSQCGAVALDSEGRIVSVGYNGAPHAVDVGGRPCTAWCPRGSGVSHQPGYSDCVALHAELNALLYADRHELVGGTLYCTRVPCMACAKSIAGAGVTRCVFGTDEGGLYHRPDDVIGFLEMCGIEVLQYG